MGTQSIWDIIAQQNRAKPKANNTTSPQGWNGVGSPTANNPHVPTPFNGRTGSADSQDRSNPNSPEYGITGRNDAGQYNYDVYQGALAGYGQGQAAASPYNVANGNAALAGGGSSVSGGGGSRGGGGGSSSAAAMNAIRQLWAMYQRPADKTLADKIAELTGQAQQTGQGAMQTLLAGLQGQQNPYQNMPGMPQASAATNPLATYMQASGADPTAVNSLQALLQQNAGLMNQADQSNQTRMQQAWQGQQGARIGDVQQQQQQFQQALAQQQLGLQYQEQQRQQKAKEDLMMQILQMSISSGANLGSMGVKF